VFFVENYRDREIKNEQFGGEGLLAGGRRLQWLTLNPAVSIDCTVRIARTPFFIESSIGYNTCTRLRSLLF